jgi:hypothetical protein
MAGVSGGLRPGRITWYRFLTLARPPPAIMRLAAIHRAKESSMKKKAPSAVLTLTSSYYAARIGDPLDLLDDSRLLLERAQHIVDTVCIALKHAPNLDNESLALALSGAATLIDMGAGSVAVAHTRFEEIRDSRTFPI